LQVGDRKLTKPIKLMFSVWQWGNLASGPMPLNEEMVLRVYETGGMVGVPESAMKETTYVTSVGWGFRTYLVVLYEEK